MPGSSQKNNKGSLESVESPSTSIRTLRSSISSSPARKREYVRSGRLSPEPQAKQVKIECDLISPSASSTSSSHATTASRSPHQSRRVRTRSTTSTASANNESSNVLSESDGRNGEGGREQRQRLPSRKQTESQETLEFGRAASQRQRTLSNRSRTLSQSSDHHIIETRNESDSSYRQNLQNETKAPLIETKTDAVSSGFRSQHIPSAKYEEESQQESALLKVHSDELNTNHVYTDEAGHIVHEVIYEEIDPHYQQEHDAAEVNDEVIAYSPSSKQVHDGDSGTHNQRQDNRSRTQEDDDAPPQLIAELGPTDRRPPQEIFVDGDNVIRVQSPGGTQQYVQLAHTQDGTEIYLDANGEEVQMVDPPVADDLRTVEFNFLDSKNICCGLCGQIVPYDTLMSHHLPNEHPDVLAEGGMNLEEIPYESWLRDKLYVEKKNLEGGFRTYDGSIALGDFLVRPHRPLRRVSQIRVNPVEMSLQQLEMALKRKMIEKLGRKVPVSLVDKQHARCGICNAVVSLNRKFETVHLVRHFNAWHPSAHRCAGTWRNRPLQLGSGKPLTMQDFAVVDANIDAVDNLQCIWCGMFLDKNGLAMHFTEVHPEEIEVPKCLLCLQELVINARLLEKYGEDFEVVLPDEFHVKCAKFDQTYNSEAALDRAISRRVQRMHTVNASSNDRDVDDEPEKQKTVEAPNTNSRMQFGRRNKPKRSFVAPALRQAVPINSAYVEAVSDSHWRCKLCSANIFGAVISAGAIRHYKTHHPAEMENMQYELCKARLERISDGCMEFVHPQLVECLLCNLTYALHHPYNLCRGIRHLKVKHPELMPEYNNGLQAKKRPNPATILENGARVGEIIDDPEIVARFKNEYQMEFDKIQTFYGTDGEPVYVLLSDNQELDGDTIRDLATSLDDSETTTSDAVASSSQADVETEQPGFEEDPYADLRDDVDEELVALERNVANEQREDSIRSSRMTERLHPLIPSAGNQQFVKNEELQFAEDGVYEEEIVEQYDEVYDHSGQVQQVFPHDAVIEEEFIEGEFIDEHPYGDHS